MTYKRLGDVSAINMICPVNSNGSPAPKSAAQANAAKKDSPIAYRTFIVIRFQTVFALASL